MAQYELCDSPEALSKAIQALEGCTVFAFDCEGWDLGAQGGKMALLSCKPLDPESETSYLIDALAFTQEQLSPLMAILSNEAVRKIVWDGRMDYSEVWHGYGVELKGTLDLQIADITGRLLRGEGRREQVERLCSGRHITPSHVKKYRPQYTDVHRIGGLKGAAEEFGFLPPRKPREPRKEAGKANGGATAEKSGEGETEKSQSDTKEESVVPSASTESNSSSQEVPAEISKPGISTEATEQISVVAAPDAEVEKLEESTSKLTLSRVDVDHTIWMERPLTDQQLRYAVADVDLIAMLYDLFKKRGYIKELDLLRQSHAYVSMYKEERPDNGNIYSRHSLLPLDILDLPDPESDDLYYKCSYCERRLRERCFSESALDIGGSHRCCVCEAVFRYVQMRKRQGRPP